MEQAGFPVPSTPSKPVTSVSGDSSSIPTPYSGGKPPLPNRASPSSAKTRPPLQIHSTTHTPPSPGSSMDTRTQHSPPHREQLNQAGDEEPVSPSASSSSSSVDLAPFLRQRSTTPGAPVPLSASPTSSTGTVTFNPGNAPASTSPQSTPPRARRNEEPGPRASPSPSRTHPGATKRSPPTSYVPPPPSPAQVTQATPLPASLLHPSATVPPSPSSAALQLRHLQLSSFFVGGEVVCLTTDRKTPLAARLATGAAAATLMTPGMASLAPGAGVYELVEAPEVTALGNFLGSTGHVSLVDCQLEVFKLHDMPYLGFRSISSGGKFLQAKRRGSNRLVFFNSYFGVNEQWGLLDVRVLSAPSDALQQHPSPASASSASASPRGPAWDVLEITMAPRQLPAFEVKVVVIRVPAHLRHRSAPHSRSPARTSPVAASILRSIREETSGRRRSSDAGSRGSGGSPTIFPQRLQFGASGAPLSNGNGGELSLNPSPKDSGNASKAGSEKGSPDKAAVQVPGASTPPAKTSPSSYKAVAVATTPVQVETERVLESFVARWQAAAPFSNTQVPSAAPQVHQVIAGSMMSRWSEFVTQEVDVLKQVCAYVARLREEGKSLELSLRDSLRQEAAQSQVEIVEIGREIQAHGREMLRKSQEVLAATFSKLVRHFIYRRRLRILGQCFGEWRGFAWAKHRTRTVDLAELERARNLDLLAQTLRFWAATTAELKDLRRGIEQVKRRRAVSLARRVLHGWSECTARRSAALHLLSCVRRRSDQATKAAAFSGWWEQVAMLRGARRKAEARGREQDRLLLLDCFGSWRQVAHQLITARFTIEVALADRTVTLLKETFYAWASYAFDRTAWRMSQLARGQELHAQALLRTAFTGWKGRLFLGLQASKAVHSLEQRHLRLFLRSAFDGWKALAQRTRRVKAILRARYERIAVSTLRYSWDSWRMFVAEERRSRALTDRAYAHFARGYLLRCLHGWQHVTEVHRRQRHVLRVLLQRKARWVLLGVLRGWHEYAATSQRTSKGAVALRRRHLLRTSFAAWEDVVEEQRRLRRIGQRVVRVLEESRLARAFQLWRGWAVRKRSAMAVALRFLGRKEQGVKVQSFLAWASLARSRRAGILALEARRTARQRQTAIDCLRAWQGVAEFLQARRTQAIGALTAASTTLLVRRVFHAWREAAVASPALEAAAEGFHRILSRKRDWSLKQVALASWVQAVQDAKQKKRATVKAYAHLRRTLLEGTFGAWKEAVAFASKRRQMIAACEMRKRVAVNWFLEWYWQAFSQEIDWTLHTLYDGYSNTLRRLESIDRQIDRQPLPGAPGLAPIPRTPPPGAAAQGASIEERLHRAGEQVKWYQGLGLMGSSPARPGHPNGPPMSAGKIETLELLTTPAQGRSRIDISTVGLQQTRMAAFQDAGLATPFGVNTATVMSRLEESTMTDMSSTTSTPVKPKSPLEARILYAMQKALPENSPLMKFEGNEALAGRRGEGNTASGGRAKSTTSAAERALQAARAAGGLTQRLETMVATSASMPKSPTKSTAGNSFSSRPAPGSQQPLQLGSRNVNAPATVASTTSSAGNPSRSMR